MSKPSLPSLKRDPLSATAREVLALFSDALAEVRFPDVDLQSLESAADELRALQLEVERIEAELDVARAAVSAQSDALTAQAERGLAYARIFAASNTKLAARVADIGQGQAALGSAGVAPKKRGRARKVDGDASLFGSVQDESPEPDSSSQHAAENAA